MNLTHYESVSVTWLIMFVEKYGWAVQKSLFA